MLIELSPVAYTALCALVKDALQEKSDASPLLERVAKELASATSGNMLPEDLAEDTRRLEALRQNGFAA